MGGAAHGGAAAGAVPATAERSPVMKFHWLSMKAAALLVVLVGMPMVQEAKADSITSTSFELAGAIIEAAGHS